MVKEIKLEFPEFITHISMNNSPNILKKVYKKIGFNSIYSVTHFITRSKMVGEIHRYLHTNIPNNLKIQTPIQTKLIIYVPVNYGDVKYLLDKKVLKRRLSWKIPYSGYKAKWDIFNLAAMWLKCLDDVLVEKGMIKDDSIEYLVKGSYEFRPCDTIQSRKLVYMLKTIENGV